MEGDAGASRLNLPGRRRPDQHQVAARLRLRPNRRPTRNRPSTPEVDRLCRRTPMPLAPGAHRRAGPRVAGRLPPPCWPWRRSGGYGGGITTTQHRASRRGAQGGDRLRFGDPGARHQRDDRQRTEDRRVRHRRVPRLRHVCTPASVQAYQAPNIQSRWRTCGRRSSATTTTVRSMRWWQSAQGGHRSDDRKRNRLPAAGKMARDEGRIQDSQARPGDEVTVVVETLRPPANEGPAPAMPWRPGIRAGAFAVDVLPGTAVAGDDGAGGGVLCTARGVGGGCVSRSAGWPSC